MTDAISTRESYTDDETSRRIKRVGASINLDVRCRKTIEHVAEFIDEGTDENDEAYRDVYPAHDVVVYQARVLRDGRMHRFVEFGGEAAGPPDDMIAAELEAVAR